MDINSTELEGSLRLGLGMDVNGLRVEGDSIRKEGIIHYTIHIHTPSNTSISGTFDNTVLN